MRSTATPSYDGGFQQGKDVNNSQFLKGSLYLSPMYIFFLIQSFFSFFIEFLVYLLPMYIVYFIQLKALPDSFYYPRLFYPIEDEIISTTTRVIFTHSKHNKQQICLKMWQRDNEQVCNNELVIRHIDYLLEGFKFNKRFAPGVYLGVAPVKRCEDGKILRGKLIEVPEETKLKQEVDYALVMRCLDSDLRLDHQLCQGELGTRAGIEFLAKEVARMHRLLKKSPDDKGKPSCISSKLDVNRRLFEEALKFLASNCDRAASFTYMEKYRSIGYLMGQTYEKLTELFQQRYDNQCIKRCHGDLKATNLWVRPRSSFFGLKKDSQELIALDCVDFNPEFCHIDTLSDVAMLAIDIETRLTDYPYKEINKHHGQKLAKHFLRSYLQETEENSKDTLSLLEYYMTEKAMVCAYVSILYDDLPELGKKYLDVALVHAKRLERMPGQHGNIPSSKSLVLSVVGAHSR